MQSTVLLCSGLYLPAGQFVHVPSTENLPDGHFFSSQSRAAVEPVPAVVMWAGQLLQLLEVCELDVLYWPIGHALQRYV